MTASLINKPYNQNGIYNPHYLNKNQITNCITEIPQRIKLDLNKGTLTLKAGSEVTIPNGFEKDGVTPHFDYVTIDSDKIFTYSDTAKEDIFFVYDSDTDNITFENFNDVRSGHTAPTDLTFDHCFWYDLTNNIIKYTLDKGANWSGQYSLPFCHCTRNPQINSIKQIYNGFGYMGNCIYVYKGSKFLVSNGRQEDGTLKNIELTLNHDVVRDFSSFKNITNGTLVLRADGSGISLNSSYIEGDILPDNFTGIFKNNVDNTCFSYINGVSEGFSWVKIGHAGTDANGGITSLRPDQPVDILKRSDFSEISGLSAPSDNLIPLSVPKSETTLTASRAGWYCIKGTASVASQTVSLAVNGLIGVSPHSVVQGNIIQTCAQVRKGGKVLVSYNTPTINYFGFCPAEGEV